MKKDLKILLIANFLNMFGYGLFGPLYAIFVTEIGGNAFHAGATWALYSLTSGLLMFLFGKLEDEKFDIRKTIVFGYFVLALGALSFLFIEKLWHLYLVQVLNAIGAGILTPAWKDIYSKSEDKGKEAEEWALFDGGDKLLLAVASLLGGYLITVTGFNTLFLIMFVLQIIGAFISLNILKNESN